MIDYVSKLGCQMVRESPDVRVLFRGRNVIFRKIEADVLRKKINEAMDNAVAHYQRNVASSGVAMEPMQIEEAALNVVLHTLYIYNMWRHTYPQHRNQPLIVAQEELAHVQAHDECLHYCEREYGRDYPMYAAALTGMTAREFSEYEEGRRRFWNR